MSSYKTLILALVLLASVGGSRLAAQGRAGTPPEPLPAGQTNEPFPQPIVSSEGVITVTLASLLLCPTSAASPRA